MRFALRLPRILLTLAPPVLGLSILAGGLAMSERYRAEIPLSPPVGELVLFRPSARAAAPAAAPVTLRADRLEGQGMAATPSGAACRFESATLLGTAGSLMVIGVEPGGTAVDVHWAGGATASAESCGSAESLRLERHAYLTLRNLAEIGLPALPPPVMP